MAWYSREKTRATWQIGSDVVVAVWTVVWFVVGRLADGAIRAVAEPLRATVHQTEATAADLRMAGAEAGRIPGVGESLRAPFDSAAGSLDAVASAVHQQIVAIELAATVTGLLTFALPFLAALGLWLPRRLTFARASAAGRHLLTTEAGRDLLALRAMASQPLHRLRRVTAEPVEQWRAGDPRAIRALAALEARTLGLPDPPDSSDPPDPTHAAIDQEVGRG